MDRPSLGMIGPVAGFGSGRRAGRPFVEKQCPSISDFGFRHPERGMGGSGERGGILLLADHLHLPLHPRLSLSGCRNPKSEIPLCGRGFEMWTSKRSQRNREGEKSDGAAAGDPASREARTELG